MRPAGHPRQRSLKLRQNWNERRLILRLRLLVAGPAVASPLLLQTATAGGGSSPFMLFTYTYTHTHEHRKEVQTNTRRKISPSLQCDRAEGAHTVNDRLWFVMVQQRLQSNQKSLVPWENVFPSFAAAEHSKDMRRRIVVSTASYVEETIHTPSSSCC